MGHLVNPIGVRLGYSTTWLDAWSATNKLYYFSYYSNIILTKTYLNYFFSREYVENFGIFFSHFSIVWKHNKFMIEISLYDGKIEDWIESCSAVFSQDFKRLILYVLNAFDQSSKNVEFARSTDIDLFKFSALLVLKLIFKMDEEAIQNAYSLGLIKEGDKTTEFLFSLIDYLVSRSREEDLVLKRVGLITRFFLRLYCLVFYQLPLYTYMTSPLKADLFSILRVYPHISLLGLENKNVTSSFISRFLARKLAQKYRWAELMSSLRKELNYMTDTEKLIFGYKIQFRGRFTRRSRSEAVSSGYGRVSTSTVNAEIDYSSSSLTLRNGSGSVKVWLYRAPRFRVFSYRIL